MRGFSHQEAIEFYNISMTEEGLYHNTSSREKYRREKLVSNFDEEISGRVDLF